REDLLVKMSVTRSRQMCFPSRDLFEGGQHAWRSAQQRKVTCDHMFMRGDEIMNQDLLGIEAADIAVDYVESAVSPIIVRGNVRFMDETQCWLQVVKLIGFSPLRLDAEARCRKGAIVPEPNGDDAHVGRQVLRWGRIAEEKPVHGRIPAARLKEEPHPRGPGAKPGNDDANAPKCVRQGGRICNLMLIHPSEAVQCQPAVEGSGWFLQGRSNYQALQTGNHDGNGPVSHSPHSRDSPDESQTGTNVRVFLALLQDRREVLTATSGLIHSGDSQTARSSSSSRYESRHCRERHARRPPST